MSASKFRIEKHTVSCQHIRGYLRATVAEDDALSIAVNQYTPLDNPTPSAEDINIIAAHANSFCKELYEPLWDDLLDQLPKDIRIRSIYMADMATQGESGALNQDKLGNDPHWEDHARDLLAMINSLRISPPAIGIGHSVGATQLVNLALIHPRFLTAVILIDPIIAPKPTPKGRTMLPAVGSTFQEDSWSSWNAAQAALRSRKFYDTWDQRTLDLQLRYALAERKTTEGSVTLQTTKHQEAVVFARPCYPQSDQPLSNYTSDRRLEPENVLEETRDAESPFYRPESQITYAKLPWLRPACLYLIPSESAFAAAVPELLQRRLEVTGVNPGGSGGPGVAAVENKIVEGGHFCRLKSLLY